MKTTDFVSVNVHIRVFENNLLRNEQFERMLQAKSFEEALNVLKDTPYRNDIEELKKSKDYDGLLTKETRRTYEELFTITPEPALVELFALRYAYHNLKVLLKEKLTKKNLNDLLIPIGRYPISALKKAIETGRAGDLDDTYLESIDEVKLDYEEYHNIQSVDIILDRRYFTHLKKIAVKLKDEKILDLMVFYIDLNNLSTLSRAISQGRSHNFLTTILSSSGSIPKEDLMQLVGDDLVSAGKKLSETKYKDIIQASIDQQTHRLSPVMVDLMTDNAFMNRMKDAKFNSFGPMPMISYIYAKETEIKNLRLILVGKENNLPISRIRERMRMNYVS